ncbi:hypothetical protein BYT27DRAFT_7260829 [Phlegmacium glaucopus]|nr:hypothetical protein BYT27DRAFT_7260829 [Phlegmacium glaucopus]
MDDVNIPIAPWNCGDVWQHPVPNPAPQKHWEKCRNIVTKYDEEMVKAWKGEVDNLLIFAGLFSATVTSFTVESYKWLDESPNDVNTLILTQISTQLSQAFPNASAPLQTTFPVGSSAVRINIYWFLSLTLSITTVLIGILCMQWLREFQRDTARSHKDAIAMRQMRFEGLLIWKVPYMLSLLPLGLQSALLLFFAGLLELLWARNRTVAIVISVAIGIVCLFLVATTILPALQSLLTVDPHLRVGQCPYKSPQSWAFYRSTRYLVQTTRFIIAQLAAFIILRKPIPSDVDEAHHVPHRRGISRFGRFVEVNLDKSWVDYDIRWRLMRDASFFDEDHYPCEPVDGNDIVHGLTWIDQTFTEDVDTVYLIFHCLLDLANPQATQMVRDLAPDVDYLVKLLYPTDADIHPPLYHDSPIPDIQIREHILTVFLWLHKNIHQRLNESYLECTIRLMNTSRRTVPLLALRQSDDDLEGLCLETLIQLFNALKLMVASDAITVQQGSEIWALLRDLYIKDPRLHPSLLTLTFDILEQFHLWLAPSASEKPFIGRVETCVVGVIRMFALMDLDHVSSLRKTASFYKLENLVRTLDARSTVLQGESAIMRGLKKRRWPELMGKIFPANPKFSSLIAKEEVDSNPMMGTSIPDYK